MRLRFYYGWIVVAAAFLVLFMTYGVQYSVGISLVAREEDLGWSRSQLSLAFTLYVITYITIRTATGRGTQWIILLVGGIILSTGLVLLSVSRAP